MWPSPSSGPAKSMEAKPEVGRYWEKKSPGVGEAKLKLWRAAAITVRYQTSFVDDQFECLPARMEWTAAIARSSDSKF